MMIRSFFIFLFLIFSLFSYANQSPADKSHVDKTPIHKSATDSKPAPDVKFLETNFKSVGKKANFSVMFINIYDAFLKTPSGRFEGFDSPLLLTIQYNVDIKAKKLIYRTVESMEKQGFKDKTKLDAWSQALQLVFPDIKDGDRLTGYYRPNMPALFYDKDGRFLGQVDDVEFSKHFFGIWLAENTRAPGVRRKLIGQ